MVFALDNGFWVSCHGVLASLQKSLSCHGYLREGEEERNKGAEMHKKTRSPRLGFGENGRKKGIDGECMCVREGEGEMGNEGKRRGEKETERGRSK